MLRIALLIISLSLTACGKGWPIDPPVVWQCQFNFTKEHPEGGFFCRTTHEDRDKRLKEFRPLTDPRMKGAQVLPPDDYVLAEEWTKDMKKWIADHCE